MSRQQAPPRVESDRLVGTELGEYRIESVIGRGGMGVVYLALDDLDRRVALKLMLPELANNQDFRERFIRESQAVIDHPNVVTVYEAGEIENTLYLAMEFIDGFDLKALIEQEGRLLPARAVALFKQAADALDAAHGKGLVHRDVKPQNMLISPAAGPDDQEHVYLSDFGLVKRTQSQSSFTHSAYLMGTVQYMSPEQIEGKNVDGRADVYGLGCVIYEAITGQLPFDKDSDVSVMWAHINDPPPVPSSVVPVLPQPVDEVIAKALAKNRDDRYLTCGELVTDLAQAFGVSSGKRARPVWSSGSVAASLPHDRPGSLPKKTPRTVSDSAQPVGRPGGGWVAAGLALLVAVASITVATRGREPRRLTTEAGAAAPTLPAEAPGDEAELRDGSAAERRGRGRDGQGKKASGPDGRNAAPGRNRRRAGGEAAPAAASEPDPAPVVAPRGIVAPMSGDYHYRQQGYEQQCLNTCSGGQNLPDAATLQSVRQATASDRVTVRSITAWSSRWRTEITTDYFDDHAEITSIEMRHAGTPAWRERVVPAAPIQWARFPATTGSKWSGQWDDDRYAQDNVIKGSYSIEVMGRPTVTIAGRKVRTYKFHTVINFTGTHTGKWDLNVWIDPKTRAIVKTSGTIRMDAYEMSVLTTLRAGPGY